VGGSGLVPGDLAGDVGDHRSVPVELTRILCETGEGLEVDGDLHPSPIPTLPAGPPVEEVQEDVGAKLIDASRIISMAGRPG
jgi:hypothetical protein